MAELTIALLQMTAHGCDQQANRIKGEEFCRRAADLGADIALFPEMWNIGFSRFDPTQPGSRDAWQAQAITEDSPYVAHYCALANTLGMGIALTYLEQRPGGPRNSVSLIDRQGRIAMTYAKVHTCDWDRMEAACVPGDGFRVCELDTAAGPVRVGAMICFDREFPESARVLMLQGAEIILTPNACEMEASRLGQLRARAYENMVGVALANYAAPQENGHSVAYSPIAFGADERPLDPRIVEAGAEEGVYLARFDLEGIRAYRAREVWGNAFRKPYAYSMLTSDEIRPPFVREAARRRPGGS